MAPGVLITADHVTGKALNYENASRSDQVFIPRRDVSVQVSATKVFSGVKPENYPAGIVTPSPFESIDAARIGYANLNATPFSLSACEIESETDYRVLIFNDGNVYEPTPITIRLKAYGRSALGDAGSVAVMTGPSGMIEEGDSGSPVLAPDNRVIGLVSAINANSGSEVLDEVHVTLVRSFLDLIPLQIGQTELLDIPCSERIRLLEVDNLRDDLVVANNTIGQLTTRLDEMELGIGTLSDRNKILAAQINTLLRNQIRLAFEAERAGGDGVNMHGDEAMTVFEENILLADKGKDLFAQPLGRAPLRPTVSRISSALGNPKWTLSGRINTNQDVTITLAYERTLAGPPHSLNMYFCFRPIHWDVPGDTPVMNNPMDNKYYEKFDGPFEEMSDGLDPLECDKVSHTASNAAGTDPNLITKGLFNTEIPNRVIRKLKSLHDREYPDRSWDGYYYLQVFAPIENPNGNDNLYRLHTRAIIDVVRDADEVSAASGLPCRFFEDTPAKSRDLLNELSQGNKQLEKDEICAQDI